MKKEEKMIKVLITGSKGFIGTHLIHACHLNGIKCLEIDKDYDENILKEYCLECDFIVHLAGVMRPAHASEFYEVGNDLTEKILNYIKNNKRKPSIIFASSIQAALNNDYGKSKTEIENRLNEYSKEFGNKVFIYRLSNVFGKWGRPNYNSVAATFCNNIANGLPIVINDASTIVNFIYIDDVIDAFVDTLKGKETFNLDGYYSIRPIYPTSLKYLSNKLYSFKESLSKSFTPILESDFDVKLLCTFSSYIQNDQLTKNSLFIWDAAYQKYYGVKYLDSLPNNCFLRSSVIFVNVVKGQIVCNIYNPQTKQGNKFEVREGSSLMIPSGSIIKNSLIAKKTKIICYIFNPTGCEIHK